MKLLHEIEIKDRKTGVLFGLPHLKHLEKLGWEENKDDHWAVIHNQYIIVLAGIKAWHEQQGIACDITLTDVTIWAEEHWDEFLGIIRDWNESTIAGKPIQEFAEEVKKHVKKK